MYKYLDQLFPNVEREIKRLFKTFTNVANFDELNTLSKKTSELYSTLSDVNIRFYLKIAQSAYDKAFKEGLEFKGDTKDFNSYRKELTKAWLLLSVLSAFNPVTGYVYKNEVDRKRARFYEMLVATMKIAPSNKVAFQHWKRQTLEYAISVVDEATIQGFKDAGVEYVIRKSQNDARVCEKCRALNNKKYRIDKIPPKTHYNCRCYYIPSN